MQVRKSAAGDAAQERRTGAAHGNGISARFSGGGA